MLDQFKEYSPEQISNTEKMCRFLRVLPEERCNYIVSLAMAYMNGVEYGIALERDARQKI